MSQIVPMVVNALVTHLTNVCITRVADVYENDPTIADVVKLGRFQDDPINKNIHIAVNSGDPENPDYVDGILTLEEMDNIGMYFPVGELGGGRLWYRRGVVYLGCYFVRDQLAELVAFEHAYTVLGRIQQAIPQLNVASLTDSFGEQAIMLFCYGNTFSESGGPPGSYLWRGKIMWSCLTSRPQ